LSKWTRNLIVYIDKKIVEPKCVLFGAISGFFALLLGKKAKWKVAQNSAVKIWKKQSSM